MSCKDCRFFCKEDTFSRKGTCKRFPPIPMQSKNFPDQWLWKQPPVDEYDDCGEYRRMPPEEQMD